MRGAASRSALALVVCLAAAGGAQAQTLTDERVWFMLTVQARPRPDSPWRWSGDVVVRSRDGVSDVDTTTLRPSIHFAFDSHSTVGGGYGFVMSFPERLERIEEHRWFAQYVWTGNAAGGTLAYRARIEARFIEGNSGEVTRLRQQLRFAHAIRPKSRVALAVYDEFLVHLNETTRLARGIEQNRGSTHYVDTLSDNALTKIYANLNFDMLGSPNYVRFVYDGDGSDTELAGPPGSAQIEEIFTGHYADAGLASEPSPFNGRSDYGPFIAVGIPAGGLFSGAEGVKTPEQAAIYGGTAGVAYDVCYHQACDTINNVNTTALSQMGDAAADAVWTLAKSKTGFFDDGSFKRPATKSKVAKSATQHSAVAQR